MIMQMLQRNTTPLDKHRLISLYFSAPKRYHTGAKYYLKESDSTEKLLMSSSSWENN